MITVEEACTIIMRHVPRTPFAPTLVEETNGCVLAQDVLAPHPHPLFDTSAVDGFAINGDGPAWRVVGTVPAGAVLPQVLGPGECARIFTGAQVPAGTRCVVMQEQCAQADAMMRTTGPIPAEGANVRRRGEQFTAGELLLSQGERLGPEAIGLLASAGLEEVEVAFKPYVVLVRTGGEFIERGSDPAGRIFSSNDRMLHAALHAENAEVDEPIAWIAEDDEQAIRTALQNALEADVIITTGGVSVGDHDLVESALRSLGAKVHFHGVAQKPGKPMLFATLQGKPVFGLPGNPRAVMVLYWEYVLPFLRAMQGARDPWPRKDSLPLAHPLTVNGERSEFRAARVQRGRIELLSDEGSHMLRSLAHADALAYLPAEKRAWKEGESVEVHWIHR